MRMYLARRSLRKEPETRVGEGESDAAALPTARPTGSERIGAGVEMPLEWNSGAGQAITSGECVLMP
jgi:hypothetical protein